MGAMSTRPYLSIGEVLGLLRAEFPDVTVSKIRFLESQGLVNPERTPSGYRKFYDEDVGRLRWILRQQRDHFLPLKVIRSRLDAADRAGTRPWALEAAGPGGEGPGVPGSHDAAGPGPSTSISEQPGFDARGDVLVAASQPRGPGGSSPVAAVAVSRGTAAREPASAPSATSDQLGVARARSGHRGAEAPWMAPRAVPARRADLEATTENRPSTGPSAGSVERRPAWHQGVLDAARPEGPTIGRLAEYRGRTAERSEPVSRDDGAGPSGGTGSDAEQQVVHTMTLAELAAHAGLDEQEVEALEEHGLIQGRQLGGTRCFDEQALRVAKLQAAFRRFGAEARHLKPYLHAARREAGFVAQLVLPQLMRRTPEARRQAREQASELARLGLELHRLLLEEALRNELGQ
jgi:DNA-binding transcriptional MerR regulator